MTEDAAGLLTLCLQDLRAGAADAADRLPPVAALAQDPALAAALTEEIEHARDRAAALAATGRTAGGAANLWMGGILDDSARDTRMIAQGPLLDVAMIGAVRKALAAETVSHETAEALARALGEDALAEDIAALRAAANDGDRRLQALLGRRVAAAARDT